MKKIGLSLAIAGLFVTAKMSAVSFNDVQFWTGTGTNRAGLVIEWSTPEDFTGSTVPAPIADKSLVWGYRFNGSKTAEQMLDAVVATDPRFYVIKKYFSFGVVIYGLGYHLNGGGDLGITDGAVTNYFTNGLLTNWGGWQGPSWELWTESGDAGGFSICPDRGTNAYWTATDTDYFGAGLHGQWDLAYGLDTLPLTDGSWIGFSVAAGPYDWNNNPDAPYNAHKHAPQLPDTGITALVKNLRAGFSQPGVWRCQFLPVSGWTYTLERSTNLADWSDVMTAFNFDSLAALSDLNPPADHAYYRVRAQHP